MANADLARLGRILGLLGSEHEGERAAAALAADRLVKRMGAEWPALIGASASPRDGGAGVPAVRNPGEWNEEQVKAAQARMRQVRDENERLRHENALLKRRLSDIAAQERKLRYE